MFEKKVWNDRQSEHPARRRLTPTENDNEYEVSRAEGLVMEEGDAFDATTMNDLENRVAKAFAEYDPAELGAVNVTVQLYTCKKEGKVYQLTGSGAVGRCKIPAAWASGDTWTVNGTTVPAYCGADAVDGDTNALPVSRMSPSAAQPTRRSTSRRTPPLTPKRASPTSPRCPIGAAGTILCRAMMAADTARQVARNRALSSARSSKMARI